MNTQCILCAFFFSILLFSSAALNAEGVEVAEDAAGAPSESFNILTDKVLHSMGREFGEEAGGSVIAVLSIRNSDGRDSRLGNYLEERLVDLLISKTSVSVVERNQMKQLVQEWGYSLSGMLEEDFYIGRGRDFQKDRAFLESFFSLCRVMQEELGRADFLDGSFLDYLEASVNVELKRGSRQNYTLRVRKDQFEARYLYNFFFSDGRSQTVWYYDEKSYGWHTNPYFQSIVESGYDTFGVPDMYRDSVVRSAAYSVRADASAATLVSVNGGRIECTGTGSTPEWALLQALMKAALLVETRLEVVTFRDDAGAIDFVAEYAALENLERLSGNITSQEVHSTEDMYFLKLHIGD